MATSRCIAYAAWLLVADGFRVVNKKRDAQIEADDEPNEPDEKAEMIQKTDWTGLEESWGLKRLGADTRSRSGGGVTIFVVDTGVRVSHNEFSGRAAPGLDLTGEAPQECSGDLSCARDLHGRGTGCAAGAAGETMGVAPGAAVRSVKVLTPETWIPSHTRSHVDSILLAVRGLNGRLTGGRENSRENRNRLGSRLEYALKWITSSTRPTVALIPVELGWDHDSHETVQRAVDAAVGSGVTVVVAAGESHSSWSGDSNACQFSPANARSAITVGATDGGDVAGSNFGECLDIWAPGRRPASWGGPRGTWLSSASAVNDTADLWMQFRTAIAASYTAGGAALLLAADPTMSTSKVLSKMLSNARLGCVRNRGGNDAILYVGSDVPEACTCPDDCGPASCVSQPGYGGRGPVARCLDRCDFCW